MKSKSLVLLGLTFGLSVSAAFTSFAGEWKQNDIGWWYQVIPEDPENYLHSGWSILDGKAYYFDEEGYMAHDTVIDGFQIGSDGARVVEDIGLPVAPYRDTLLAVFAKHKRLCDENSMYEEDFGFWRRSYDIPPTWTDCGAYYKVSNIKLISFYFDEDLGGDFFEYDDIDELYVRKDGQYIFDGKLTSIDAWARNEYYPARFSLLFDDKGYVVGFQDGNFQ